MAVGRISGPLLKDNLLRNGVNLAFESSLLYLDVKNSRIGINTANPQYDLDVSGTSRTTNLTVSNQLTLAEFTFSGNTISSSASDVYFNVTGGNNTVYQGSAIIGNELAMHDNVLATLNPATDLSITTSDGGQVVINSNVMVYGNIHATGNITADGNINLGNESSDTVNFGGEIGSSIIPNQNNQYNLGSPSLKWANVYSNSVTVDNINTTNFTANDFQTANIEITGDTISGINGGNIHFTTTGTGGVIFGNIKIFNNTITNISNNGVTEFLETGAGYVKIAGTKGVVIPTGSVAARPTGSYVETGMMRYNTELGLVEIWDSVQWVSVAGAAAGVTANVATDIGIATAITFG